MKTKATSSKSKPFKIVGIILAFIVLASMFQVLLFVFFFLSIFVLIFRAMIKQKEKTGSWFVPGYPSCNNQLPFQKTTLTTSSFHPSYDSNPLNRGSAAWHARRIRTANMR
jgi:hypothetical protein